jgi:hypothetical protein
MSIVMKMTWDGVSPAQYDAVRDAVGWETTPPAGGIMHIAWFEDGVMHIVDAWESPEQFQTFVDDRLMPGVAAVGVEGQPVVSVHPAHRMFDATRGIARS